MLRLGAGVFLVGAVVLAGVALLGHPLLWIVAVAWVLVGVMFARGSRPKA